MAKQHFGEDITIKEHVPNPRQRGRKSFKLYASMERFVDKHPKASVADLIRSTQYRRQDFDWDLERGHVKVTKLKVAKHH